MDTSTKDLIKISYIVCSTGRSGSTLFCRTLGNLDIVGNPREHFHPRRLGEHNIGVGRVDSFHNYYCEVVQKNTSDEGVFGVKMHWDQLQNFLSLCRISFKELDGESDLEVIRYMFPNPKFLYVRRDDILKQAISTEVAHQTGRWTVPKDKSDDASYSKQNPSKILLFNPLGIYRYKWGLQKMNRHWKQFFMDNSIQFHEIVYENLVASFDMTVTDALAFLEVTTGAEKFYAPTQKLPSRINARWYFYYRLIPETLIEKYANLRVKVRHTLEKIIR